MGAWTPGGSFAPWRYARELGVALIRD
jgi:hypothetical protein